METVAFYSYKGGVGRTLLLANTARFLALSGRKVVALDLDLEAPGLHYKLGSNLSERAAQGKLPGAVDELLATLSSGAQRSVRDIAIPIAFPPGCRGALWLIPAGSAPSPVYWSALEQLSELTRAPNSALLEAVLDLQARIAAELNPDFLLLDSRTGITELGGLATSIVADHVICMTNTTAESIDGIRMVAEALRQAPRLPDQQPVRLDFLVTRVDHRIQSTVVDMLRMKLGGSVSFLPHDAEIGTKEWILGQESVASLARVISNDKPESQFASFFGSQFETVIHIDSNWHAIPARLLSNKPTPGSELLSATLDWIAGTFPGQATEAAAAKRRMLTVGSAWEELTRRFVRVGEWLCERDAWPPDQIHEGVRFGKDGQTRQADLVVYDGPRTKPLMVIEYIETKDGEDVARWWYDATDVPVVALFFNEYERQLYSRNQALQDRKQPSGRWDLPLPRDYRILSDPTDVSVEALLASVQRGHPDYLGHLIAEWVRCSAATLHGGSSWWPDIARKILNELAAVDDLEMARHVLLAAFPGPKQRGSWLGGADDRIDDQVTRELFGPLCWRLPAEAFIDVMMWSRGGRGPDRQRAALDLLAREYLGLTYAPDELFRVEGQRILSRNPEQVVRGGLIYSLIPLFRRFEISFDWSSAPPPVLRAKPELEGESLGGELEHFITKRVRDQDLVTTGLLGDYESATGRVVLYKNAIEQVAHRLSLRARYVGSTTLLHETIHALTHLGRDLDGRLWDEFTLPSTSAIPFEPSRLHETLAQYFTYKVISSLQDQALLQAFERLSDHQHPSYRTWRRLKDVPIEQMRQWLMNVRRGTGETLAFLSDILE